jgi:predicted thioesterase
MTTLRFTVTDDDSAIALGSGDVPVLATPRLLAWLEQATVVAAAPWLDPSSTSVGVEVWMRHRRASAVGAVVEVEVTEVVEQDRGLSFGVVARELPPAGPPREVASGRVVRAVVDRAAFLSRL